MTTSRTGSWDEMPGPLKFALWTIFGVGIFTALAFLLGWVVQFLWNSTVAEMFGWPEITYWQAIGVFLLAKLLFGFGMGSGKSSEKKDGKPTSEEVALGAATPAGEPELATQAAATEMVGEDLSSLPDDEAFRAFWDAEGREAWNAFRRDRDG